jgi:hypothetical protein
MIGRIFILRKSNKLKEALDFTSTLIAYYPNFVPAYIEKLHILFEMHSWDALLESAQRLGGMNAENIDSLIMISWYEVVSESSSDSGANFLTTTRKVIFF